LSGYFCDGIDHPFAANQAKKRRGDDKCSRGTPEIFITDTNGRGAFSIYCPSFADRCEGGRAQDLLMRRCREKFGKCFIIDEGGYPLHPISVKK